MPKPKERKLHIGCGKVYLHGWVNVDIFTSVEADLYCEMTRLPFEKESFSTLYCSHVLEHAHRHMVIATLAHWRELLRPGGTLRLAVPDFAACCQRYAKTKNLPELMGLLYGGQDYSKNSHTVIFDYAYLTECLVKAGFSITKISRWDWRNTEHADYDDFASAYLPHLQKNTGLLMSLNVEAKR